MKRVEAASGAKYSSHNEQARKFEPIAPVGTSYTPIGRPDIAGMRKVPLSPSSVGPSAAPATSRPSAAKLSVATAPRPVFGTPAAAPVKTAPAFGRAPADSWDEEPAAAAVPPPPPPSASRPPAVPSAPRPAATSVSTRLPTPSTIVVNWFCKSLTHRLHVPSPRLLHQSQLQTSLQSLQRRIASDLL